ncbi:MAG: acetolactate synthase large subunit, partial [Myxococcota bacterium]
DIASLARPVSSWLARCDSAETLAEAAAEAIAAARRGGVATLIVPHDVQLAPATGLARSPRPAPPPAPSAPAVEAAAALLRRPGPAALYLGGAGLGVRGLRAAARIVAVRGCRLLCDTFPARVERGRGLPTVERLPYFPEDAIATLALQQQIVFAGARPPVSFFGYPGVASRLVPKDCECVALAGVEDDAADALEALADALGAPARAHPAAPPLPAPPSGGALGPDAVAATLARLQPEDAIVMDEGLTASVPYFAAAAGAAPHSYLGLTGGAIGQGLPCASGAALACPDRRVIALQADGSGMYTLQALWTQAREGLDVTNLILANRGYRILNLELARAGVAEPGPQVAALTELERPALDWVRLARGFGVPGVRVETMEALAVELERALAEPGPSLLELVL